MCDLTLSHFCPLRLKTYNREYDLGDDGSIDLVVEETGFCDPIAFSFTEAQVANSGFYPFGSGSHPLPLMLPAEALIGGTFESEWFGPVAQWRLFKEFGSQGFPATGCHGPWTVTSWIPEGIWYVPVRFPTNNDLYYYGWLELVATDAEDADNSDWILISRLGISQTPGQRIRMGQD